MDLYASLVRANPAQARNGESAFRMLMLVRGVNNMAQLESIQTIGNLLTYLHNQILMVDTQGNPITSSLRGQILTAAGRGASLVVPEAEEESGEEQQDGTETSPNSGEGDPVAASGDGEGDAIPETENALSSSPPTSPAAAPAVIPRTAVSKLDLGLATLLDLLKEVQCLLEIIAVTGSRNILRGGFFGVTGRAAGILGEGGPATPSAPTSFQVGLYSENRWATVQILTILQSLLQILLNRNYVWKYGKALGRNAIKRLQGKGTASCSATNSNISPRRTTKVGLVVPRVGAARGLGEAASPANPSDSTHSQSDSLNSEVAVGTTFPSTATVGHSGWDYVVFVLQIFYWLRPLLLAFSFTPSGLRPSVSQLFPGNTAASLVSSSASAASIPTINTAAWGPWRLWVVIEAVAVYLSIEAQRRQPPTLLPGVPTPTTATAAADQPPAVGASTPIPFGIGGSLKPLTISHDTIGARTRTALRAMLRDPFFSVVLRLRLKSLFTQSWLSRVPLAGPLLANTAQYLLDLQKMSFLATLGGEQV